MIDVVNVQVRVNFETLQSFRSNPFKLTGNVHVLLDGFLVDPE